MLLNKENNQTSFDRKISRFKMLYLYPSLKIKKISIQDNNSNYKYMYSVHAFA